MATVQHSPPIPRAPDSTRCTARSAQTPPVRHPMVVRFVLPKPRPGSTENKIGLPGARALHRVCDSPQWFVRLQENMHMVRHDRPRKEIVQPPFGTRGKQSLDNRGGDLWIFEESGAGTSSVQLAVHHEKPQPLREPSGAGLRPALPRVARQRSVQTPGQENRDALRLPIMRKPAAIESHAKEVARPLQHSQTAGHRPAPLCLS